MSGKSFAEIGKQEALRQLFEGTPYRNVQQGFPEAGGRVFTAQRMLSEGIDFDLVYFPLQHLGYKAVIGVTGPLLAAPAAPVSLDVVLGVSAKLDLSQIRKLWDGVVAAAQEQGYKNLSLDLVPSRNGLTISLGAAGVRPERLEDRPEPRSKDLLCVSGALGAAYLGLQVLERERVRFDAGSSKAEELEQYKMLVGAYLKPELPSGLCERFVSCGVTPCAGAFVANGLSDALLRLSADTKLGVKVYADKIPFEGNSFALGKELNLDPVSAAMNGGEDMRLLFAIPIGQLESFRKEFPTFDIIGHLALPEAGAVLVLPTGVEMPVRAQGWKASSEN